MKINIFSKTINKADVIGLIHLPKVLPMVKYVVSALDFINVLWKQ